MDAHIAFGEEGDGLKVTWKMQFGWNWKQGETLLHVHEQVDEGLRQDAFAAWLGSQPTEEVPLDADFDAQMVLARFAPKAYGKNFKGEPWIAPSGLELKSRWEDGETRYVALLRYARSEATSKEMTDSVLAMYEELKRKILREKEWKELVEDVEAFEQAMQEAEPSVVDKYGYSALSNDFDSTASTTRQDAGDRYYRDNYDPADYRKRLERFKERLKDLLLVVSSEHVEAIRRFSEVQSQKNYGIRAKIRVDGGLVYNELGEVVTEFSIGNSGRVMRAQRTKDGGVRVEAFYSSGNSMGAPYDLSDGVYAISRDANDVFRVEWDENHDVKTALAVIAPQGSEAPQESRGGGYPDSSYQAPAYQPPVSESELVYRDPDAYSTQPLSSFSTLADSLRAALDGKSTGLKDVVSEVKSKKELSKGDAREQGSATGEERAAIEEKAEAVRLLAKIVRGLGSKPREVKSDKDRALERVHNGVLRMRSSMERVSEQLVNERATADVLRGHLQSARTAMESAWKSSAKYLVGDGFDADPIGRIEREWREIDRLADEHPELSEYIREGLVSKDAVVTALREQLAVRAKELLSGTPIDLTKSISDVINALI